MDAVTVLVLCAIVFTAAIAAIAIFLVRVLMQVRRTAAQAEAVLHRAEPMLAEVEKAVREYGALGHQLTATAGKVDRLAGQVGGIGDKALGATDKVLSGVAGPLGRLMAIVSGVKAGVQVFTHIVGRRRGPQA
jgi:hypothetical protein